jgi:hypothetical protein
MSMQTRIEKGMALLDNIAPDWHWRIRPRILDIQDCDDCVLGQLFGGYTEGMDVVCLETMKEGYDHGFMDWTGRWFPAWMWDRNWMPSWCGAKLSREWRKAIMARRKLDQEHHVMEKLARLEVHV